MLKLGEKNFAQPQVRIGEWVRTNERFIDGYELIPFVDATGVALDERSFQTQYYPELWRCKDADVTQPDIDMSAGTLFWPSNFTKYNADQIFFNGSTAFVARDDQDLYFAADIEALTANKICEDNYTFDKLPKGLGGYLTVLSSDQFTIKTHTPGIGDTWNDHVTFAKKIAAYDIGRYVEEILAVSSEYSSDIGNGSSGYVQTVYLVKDALNTKEVVELPTTGLVSVQITDCFEFQLFDSSYNANHQYVVRYMSNGPTEPVFAFFNKTQQKWISVFCNHQYGVYNNGSVPALSYGGSKVYWAFEQFIYCFEFSTGKLLKQIRAIGKTNFPPDTSGNPVYNNDNFSYDAHGFTTIRQPYYPDPNVSGEPKYHDVVVVTGSNHTYMYVDDGKEIVDIVYSSVVSGSPTPKFLASKDGNTIMLCLSDGLIKQFNNLPASSFKIKSMKVDGVTDPSYRLVARKLP